MKTIEEINEKIKRGDVVVVNAEEMADIVDRKGAKAAAAECRCSHHRHVRPDVL